MSTAQAVSPPVNVEVAANDTAPVRQINSTEMAMVAAKLKDSFEQYRKDRQNAERNWIKNLRQFAGVYDPEIEKKLPTNQSRAYPRLTRVKALTMLARLMNLMFPGNERNWEVLASPSADIDPEDVQAELDEMTRLDQEAGAEPRQITSAVVRQAVQTLAEKRARELETEIDDQLQQIGGDQSMDYIALVRQVVRSGVLYGPGVLIGPFAEEATITTWDVSQDGRPTVSQQVTYAPVFEFLPVWDFYPDMNAKTFADMDGYWIRKVLTRAQLRDLGRRDDFFEEQVKAVIKAQPKGNYEPQSFENDLRSITAGEEQSFKGGTGRYEVLVWHGTLSGEDLRRCGADVSDDNVSEDMTAEVWMCNGKILKADMNAWRKLGRDVRTIHTFVFDDDDTTLVGNGLPSIMRDSQMAVCAATRMLLDNASVTCGPMLEINEELLRADQDTSTVGSYRVWLREGLGTDANAQAVRNISIDSHMPELLRVIELFMAFADQETFVGPGAGAEPPRGTAEPMRTAAGASMMRADAALPFKDVIRNFDTFTQSVIQSLVEFNKVFNTRVPKGDYNVIARGATSLIAKEVRGIQMDQLAATLAPEDRLHLNDRKFVEARFAVRDLQGMLMPEAEVDRRRAAAEAKDREMREQQNQMVEAELRKVLSEAFKNIALGQKSATAADAQKVNTALDALERGGPQDAATLPGTGGQPPRG